MSQIAAASGASQAGLASQVSTAVAAKTLDTVKAQGQAAISLLEDAAQLQQQSVSGSQDTHRGRLLDTIG